MCKKSRVSGRFKIIKRIYELGCQYFVFFFVSVIVLNVLIPFFQRAGSQISEQTSVELKEIYARIYPDLEAMEVQKLLSETRNRTFSYAPFSQFRERGFRGGPTSMFQRRVFAFLQNNVIGLRRPIILMYLFLGGVQLLDMACRTAKLSLPISRRC